MQGDDIRAWQSAKCLGQTLIVFSVFGCGNIFTLIMAIFLLVVVDNVKGRWMTWKTPILVIYMVGLVYAIISLGLLGFCLFNLGDHVFNRSWRRSEYIAYFIFVLAITGSTITQIIISCKAYTAFRRLFQPNLTVPAAGYNSVY